MLSRQAKRRPHQGNSLGLSRKTLSRQAKRRPHQGNSLGLSRRMLLRQAEQRCVGRGMSRHRGHPRATLSTDTHLQSPRKDILRQHFAKFHYVHPVRPTLYILNTHPRHPERSTPSSQAFRPVILDLFQDLMSNDPVILYLQREDIND